MPVVTNLDVELTVDATQMIAGNKAAAASVNHLGGAFNKGRKVGKQFAQQQEKVARSTKKMRDSGHRANLFLLNFSRGMEDLKFGLPAVINNLDSVGFSFQLLGAQAKQEGITVGKAIRDSIFSMGGMLAIMNLIITAAFLLGPILKKAFGDGAASAKSLKSALGLIFEDLKLEPTFLGETPQTLEDTLVKIKELEEVKKEIRGIQRRRRQVDKTFAVGEFDPELIAKTSAELSAYLVLTKESIETQEDNAEAFRALGLAIGFAKDNFEEATTVQGSFEPEFGSITFLENGVREHEKLRDALKKGSEAWKEQQELVFDWGFELDRVTRLSVGGASKGIEAMSEHFVELTDDVVDFGDALTDLGPTVNGWGIELANARREWRMSAADGPRQAAWGATIKRLTALMKEQTDKLKETGKEASKPIVWSLGLEIEKRLDSLRQSMKMFKLESALLLGDAAVGGAFGGFFREFKSADANQARLAIADLNAEFGDLEEALASGEISYAQFSAANAVRMDELAAAQRELALATRTSFELMAARIGNAFESLKLSVIDAFKEIAQEWVKMQVRMGILRIFAMATMAPAAGAFGETLSITPASLLPSGGVSAGLPIFPVGAPFRQQDTPPLHTAQQAQRVSSVNLVASTAILASGDLQMSVSRRNNLNSRTGV